MQLKTALNALCLAAATVSALVPAVSAHADELSAADDYVGHSAQAVCSGLAAAADDRDAVATELAAIIDDSRRYAEQPFTRPEAEYILAGAVNSNCPVFQPLLQSNGVYDAANRYAATQRDTQQGAASTPPDLPGLSQATPGQPCTNTETFVFGITREGQTLACLPRSSPSYGLSAPVIGVRTLGAACPDNGQLAQSTDGEPMMCLGTPGSWTVYRDL